MGNRMDYDGCRFFMDYDRYKLRALHQKRSLPGSNVAVSVLLAFDKVVFLKRFHEKSGLIQ
jgi:hypothetical protein